MSHHNVNYYLINAVFYDPIYILFLNDKFNKLRKYLVLRLLSLCIKCICGRADINISGVNIAYIHVRINTKLVQIISYFYVIIVRGNGK